MRQGHWPPSWSRFIWRHPQENGYLPDLDKLAENKALLERTSVLFLCSPSNPQGAIASKAYLQQAISLARAYNFMIFADECYSEIYFDEKPMGILQAAHLMSGDFSNVAAFNSLSKRSNLPGLRSGFVAGDPQFIEEIRTFSQCFMPANAASGTACQCKSLGG